MRKRRNHLPDLTSLLDVLFVVLFCVLMTANEDISQNNKSLEDANKLMESENKELKEENSRLKENLSYINDKDFMQTINSGEFYTINLSKENNKHILYINKNTENMSPVKFEIPDYENKNGRESVQNDIYNYLENNINKTINKTNSSTVIVYIYDGNVSMNRDVGKNGMITNILDKLKKEHYGKVSVIETSISSNGNTG